MIYQTHPEHGRHIAYNTLEAESNEKNGWKTVSEDVFYGKKYIMPRDQLVEAYELKYGKKPHHAMKDETIQAKLDE